MQSWTAKSALTIFFQSMKGWTSDSAIVTMDTVPVWLYAVNCAGLFVFVVV